MLPKAMWMQSPIMSTSQIVTSRIVREMESAELPDRTCSAACLEAFEKEKYVSILES